MSATSIKLPNRVCVKVKCLRPKYDNLKEWMADLGNVLVTRNGRVFIKEGDDKPYVFAYKKSPWANPYKVGKGHYTLEESLAKYDAWLEGELRDPAKMREFLKLLTAKNIGCFCDKDNRKSSAIQCHGDVIISKLRKYAPKKSVQPKSVQGHVVGSVKKAVPIKASLKTVGAKPQTRSIKKTVSVPVKKTASIPVKKTVVSRQPSQTKSVPKKVVSKIPSKTSNKKVSEKVSDKKTSEKSGLLQKIRAEFERLHQQYGEPIAYTLEKATPALAKTSLQKWGVFYIRDAITAEELEKNRKRLVIELSMHLFGMADPSRNPLFKKRLARIQTKYPKKSLSKQQLMALSCWWNSANGFGNSNFRFLYYQFLDKKDIPKTMIAGQPLLFERNPFHRHNLRLLASSPKLWEILTGLHAYKQVNSGQYTAPVVSWDSVKVRFYEGGNKSGDTTCKPTKPALTARHRDIYDYVDVDEMGVKKTRRLDRIQAMILDQEMGGILLGYVIFSQHPTIQKLIAEYLGVNNPRGFAAGLTEHPELCEILDKWWRAPRNGFVIWKQETFHYEGLPKPGNEMFKRLASFTQPANALDKLSMRWVIGTHMPVHVTKTDMKKLAVLAELGYQPLIYNSQWNRDHPAHYNVVNTKSTQWKKTREPTTYERNQWTAAKQFIGKPDQYLHTLDPLIREMYGITDE